MVIKKKGMKRNTLLVLILITFCSVTLPSTSEDNPRVIFGGTTGNEIFIRDYQILPEGHWDLVRELRFNTQGLPGAMVATTPNRQGRFSVFYSYQRDEFFDQTIRIRNVRIDYNRFEIVNEADLSGNFGGYDLAVWRVRGDLHNRDRISFFDENRNVVIQKINSSGELSQEQRPVIPHENGLSPFNISFDSGGTHMAQILQNLSTNEIIAEFRGISLRGKPEKNVVTRPFNNYGDISLGIKYAKSPNYVVATREFQTQVTSASTAVSLKLFDAADHSSVRRRSIYNYREIPANIFLVHLNTIVLYDAYDADEPDQSRSYVIYGRPKNGKLLTFLQHYDPSNLKKVSEQVLVGKDDRILQDKDEFFNYFVVSGSSPKPSQLAGKWNITFAGSCPGEGEITLGSDEQFSGSVATPAECEYLGGVHLLRGEITRSGVISGVILEGRFPVGSISGQLYGVAGSGNYQFSFGPSGTWSARKK